MASGQSLAYKPLLAPLHEPLHRYLRTLWPQAPALHYNAQAPFIAGRNIHLPAPSAAAAMATDADTTSSSIASSNGIPTAAWRWYRAAAAHAAAHLAFSPPAFDGRGLPPVTRALLGLLEDARVEQLACRELPGLCRLWAPLHTAQPADGDGFEALMLRLARSLIDPAYDDPHPWVQKGRRLFFVDGTVPVLALRRPDETRLAASLLGNDIGQMRLRFSAASYVVGPDYRDDSRWMWPAGQAAESTPAPPQPVAGPPAAPPAPDKDAAIRPSTRLAGPSAELYPEWDRLISRLRHDWCAVFEDRVAEAAEAPPGPSAAWPGAGPADAPDAADQALRRHLQRVLQRHRQPPRYSDRRLSHDGDAVDIDALVLLRVAQRQGLPIDARIHRRAARGPRDGRWVVLIDQSASSANSWARAGIDLLQASRRVAALIAAALQPSDVQVAISGFQSNGRHHVALRCVKGFADTFGPAVQARLDALRSAHSTRLGAALRYATRRLKSTRFSSAPQLLVISDGALYDIDVHDPHYLVADARHAALGAARQGVRLHCIVLDQAGLAPARKIFGARAVGSLDALHRLPAVAARLAL